ncbi:O-antigen ligase family protein [Desulfosporosinus meridiei]|uniref:O-Antigen ligase n=1 Tax=Desulfosporosinus meridiei (strain ATCC BAA-275 / DSM 13257 / KCTC 12902 / NCIMB 13706 / S10) TaxID=768704 RepID=J7J4S2_DESMD|nr:O-antigen ligase family protein [Desulfosporosinus meridiei]AFQ45941.1 O-Antigen ligase [Desulfosporosinus meridiei DSM 13257]
MELQLEPKQNVTALGFRLSKQTLANLCFMMFLASDMISFCTTRLFRLYGLEDYAWILTSIIIYFPLLLMPLASGERRRMLDFLLLWAAALVAFGMTIMVHPEYEAWFHHPLYGVFNYIFRPDRALYAYFMVRLVNDPKQLLKNLKSISYILVVYGLYKFANAMRVGSWLALTANGYEELSYSMSFGYDMMLPSMVFLYYAMKDKELWHWVLSIMCLFMILVAGSRAPLLWILVFFTVMLIRGFMTSKVKVIWGLTVPAFLLIYLKLEDLIGLLVIFLQSHGISARSINMLLAGSIGDDNGRAAIYEMSIELLKNMGHFGYGLYGDRYVIGNYYFWGYPHNIFLEILLTFGVLGGGLLIFFLLYHCVRTLIKCRDEDWLDLFLIFLVCSLKLLLSDSYWYVPEFWAAIAVVYSWNRQQKISSKERMKQINV